MRKIFLVLAIALLSLSIKAEARVSDFEQAIDNYIVGQLEDTIAGVAVIVIQNGDIVFNRSYGYVNRADRIPVTDDTVFDWASITKLLTWVSVMQLVEQGRLDLNADIREYLPDGFFRRLQYDTPITMYNLMHHNAGWGMKITDMDAGSPAKIVSLGDAIRRAEPKQMFEPGTVVAYSNYGSALAGYIVECITGLPFYEYVNTNIFSVLGMNDTAIHPAQADNPRIASQRDKLVGYMANLHPALSSRDYMQIYPAGSAVGTISDLAKFLSAFMPVEGEKSPLFANEASLNDMLTISYSYGDGIPGAAHGLLEEFYGVRTLGHTGSLLYAASRLFFSPEEGIGFVMMTNTDNLNIGPTLSKMLFGEYVPEVYTGNLPNIRNLNNLSGWYSSAMRLENRGFMKLMASFPSFRERIRITGDNSLRFNKMEFSQISPYVFRDESSGFRLHLNVEDNNVTRVLLVSVGAGQVTAGSVLEYTARSGFNVFITLVGIILMFLTLLFLLEVGLSRVSRKKAKSKKNIKKGLEAIPISFIEKQASWLSYAGMFVVINWYVTIFRTALFSASYRELIGHFVLNIIYMVFAPVFSGYLFWKVRGSDLEKRDKMFCVLTCVASVGFVGLMLVWELFR